MYPASEHQHQEFTRKLVCLTQFKYKKAWTTHSV